MEQERIERVRLMESALNRWLTLANEGEHLLCAMQEAAPQLEELITYYSSPDWFVDKESSDRYEFPEDLPQGVLSEDAVFDLLTQLYSLLQAVQELDERMKAVPQDPSPTPIPD